MSSLAFEKDLERISFLTLSLAMSADLVDVSACNPITIQGDRKYQYLDMKELVH